MGACGSSEKGSLVQVLGGDMPFTMPPGSEIFAREISKTAALKLTQASLRCSIVRGAAGSVVRVHCSVGCVCLLLGRPCLLLAWSRVLAARSRVLLARSWVFAAGSVACACCWLSRTCSLLSRSVVRARGWLGP